MFTIRPDPLTHPETLALLAHHLAHMHANSPPGTNYALDITGLSAPNIAVFTVWHAPQTPTNDVETIAGIGALKTFPDATGELKSMRTHPNFLRQGVATLLLAHLIAQARTAGLHRVSLETGTDPEFDAALALYRAHGFVSGPAFADYRPGPFNQFLRLSL